VHPGTSHRAFRTAHPHRFQKLVTLIDELRPFLVFLTLAAPLDAASQTGPAPEPEVIRVTGSEQLAWEYTASSSADILALGFFATIDGAPVYLLATCSRLSEAIELTCLSPLPPMSPGSHTLTVSAHFFGDSPRFGPPSNAIRLRYDPARTVEPLAERSARTPRESDSRLAEVVAVGLTDPTDLALLPDGRALVAERSGRIRMWRDGALAVEPALALADVVTGHGRGLLAVAVDRPFDATRAVFIVYTAAGGARLARFTLAGDALVDRAVLLDGLPHAPVDPAAALLVGHDGKVYLALDDGGEPARVADAGSYSGKVLRLNRDGTTPRDKGERTPVVAAGFARPSGLASVHESDDVWVAGRGAGGIDRVDVIETRRSGVERSVAASYALPPGVEVTDISILPPEAPGREPRRAVVASASGGVLRLAPAASAGAPEWIFRDATGSVVAIDVDDRGVAYVLTQERLIRLGVRQ
jgi:hypothetical protein